MKYLAALMSLLLALDRQRRHTGTPPRRDSDWTPLLDRNLTQWDVYLSYPGSVMAQLSRAQHRKT